MTGARSSHTATLLPNNKVLVAGGQNAGASLATAELFDPTAGTWSATGSMTDARSSHTGTLLSNGTVLVAGGNPGPLNTAELYDPTAGTWSTTASMADARASHTGTLLSNGEVVVAGGEGASSVLASAELYSSQSKPAFAGVSELPRPKRLCAGSEEWGYGSRGYRPWIHKRVCIAERHHGVLQWLASQLIGATATAEHWKKTLCLTRTGCLRSLLSRSS